MTVTRSAASRSPDVATSRGDPSLLLEFDQLTKRYGDHTVVDDLSFTVEPGRVTGFLGPNGSGKSTTMKMLLGLAAADHGHASVGGRQYRDLDAPSRTVGAALETNSFHPGRSGRNHLRIIAQATGVPFEHVDETLELVGIADAADRRAGTYSLGMRQRLGLAAALLGDPPILVLDEPGNGLDPQGVRSLRELLRARAAQGHTVFVSSHLLTEVEHLTDDVVVINQGRLVANGALRELQAEATLVRAADAQALRPALALAGATVDLRDDNSMVVKGIPTAEIGERAFSAGIPLHELSPHAGSLEELFLEWTNSSDDTDKEAAHP
ncbi:MAG: ABC transporter ATP-binding protein [Acidimicrobiales bacterium]